MKKSIVFICSILLIFSTVSFAQRPKSTIRFQFEDGSLMKIAVNNRNYPHIASSLIISDIPGRRPFVQIYKFRPYADGQGGKAELVFSKRLKIERGKTYEAMVNAHNKTVDLMMVNQLDRRTLSPVTEIGSENIKEQKMELNPPLRTVIRAMDAEVSDLKKLEIAKQHMGNNIPFDDARHITSSFLFDDTRLEFIKYIYPKISEQSQIATLEHTFNSPEGKTSFKEFLKNKK